MSAPAGRYLGLISGTSADGIDAALLQIHADGTMCVEAAQTTPYPPALREQLLPLIGGQVDIAIDALACLDAEVGLAFAAAAMALLQHANCPASEIRAIGSHGQTIRHRPRLDLPFTWQIGDPSRIVEATGITTVADFRRRDVAAGGQGAPLVPPFHAAWFGSATEDRAVLNLGGIANLTLLPSQGPVRGFDCGPANALLDLWAQRCGLGERDEDGRLARSGEIDEALLQRLLDDPWFEQPPPKSTGREDFNAGWLDARLGSASDPATVMSTLVALSAQATATALQRSLPSCVRLLVCGGGSHNPALLDALRRAMPALAVQTTAEHGLDPDHVEAAAFAWLARQCLSQQPGGLASVTGARGDRVLGAIYPA
ncbi:MAG: anhydro-N-acetylmuramic acid kinase [Xanthomonadales bacterium]|nr:anhydro-N-acetylmuramic acid kinase [Xanthomonadales bacterium]